jgi:hypothetical protein
MGGKCDERAARLKPGQLIQYRAIGWPVGSQAESSYARTRGGHARRVSSSACIGRTAGRQPFEKCPVAVLAEPEALPKLARDI